MQSQVESTLFPYGASTLAEVVGIVRSQCVESDVKDLEKIVSEWRDAASHFQELASSEIGIAETVSAKEIDASTKSRLDSIASDYLFQQAFSMIPWRFCLVEIDKLIACQRLVNLDYAKELASRLPTDPSLNHLIDFCLASTRKLQEHKELQLAQNAFTFSSPSPDFRFLGGYLKPLGQEDIKVALGGGAPVGVLVLLVGYGSSTCNAFAVGPRMILNNGFHRIYALRSLGIKYAPLVVQDISNASLELPPRIADLPKEYLIQSPRPVLMKDFFDKRLVRTIHRKAKIKNVQIAWNVGESFVPI